MVYILARITVKSDAAGAARSILVKLAAQSRQEPGCLAYDLYQQAASPHVFQTVEHWRDQASADTHLASAHVAAAVAAATPLLAAAPEILPYQKLA